MLYCHSMILVSIDAISMIAIDFFFLSSFLPSRYQDRNRLVVAILLLVAVAMRQSQLAFFLLTSFNVMLDDKLTHCVALSCVAYYSCPICLLVMVFLTLKEVSSCCLLSRDRSSKWCRVIPNLMWAGTSSNTLLLSDG